MPHDKLDNFLRDHRAEFDDAPAPAGLWNRIAADLGEAEADADPLSAFIATHRDAFDDATPPPRFREADVPAAEGLRVTHRRGRSLRGTLLYVAAIAACLLLMFTAYNFGNRAGFEAGRTDRIAQQVEKMNPEFAEAERFYQQRIQAEFTRVSQVNDDPQLRRDLEQLDVTTAQLRAELLEVPASQRPLLVNQLIETYRTKLDILLRIQQHFANPNLPGGHPPRQNNPNDEL